MKFDVIGREIRTYKDADASVDEGREVRREFVVLHCVNDPARKDKDNVTGRQVQSFSFFPGNGLLSDVKALDIPCVINAEVSRNGKYVNLDDFELIE